MIFQMYRREREVEFSIYLVPSTRLVPMAPYMISVLELADLKKQLERTAEKENCETKCVTLGSSGVVWSIV